ncbi:hypothetical protein PAXRUDRAFT_178031, partial [Paxillus rubicundulus Ve08.2h10]
PSLAAAESGQSLPYYSFCQVEVPAIRLTFTHSGSFQWSRQHRIADCNKVTGTIFLRGQNPPPERNVGFNAQQFPQYGTGDTAGGRLTIDFWNNRKITGVVRPTTTTIRMVTIQVGGGNQPCERSVLNINQLFFVLYDKPSGMKRE